MLQNSLKRCPDNIRTYVISMPSRIRSFVVRKDGWYTICINETLCERARLEAYKHEIDHIMRGDFDSDLPTGLIEIRAHEMEG